MIGVSVSLSASVAFAASGNTSPDTAKFASACKSIRTSSPTAQRTIDVAVSPYSPPFESVDPNDPSKIVGLEPSIIAQLSHCLGFKYTYTSEGFANVITSLQSGRSPLGITTLFLNSAREKVIGFVPYRTSIDRLVSAPAMAKKLHRPMDLCGLHAAVLIGGVESGYLQHLSTTCQAAHKQPISISPFPDAGTEMLSVAQGRVDFSFTVIGDMPLLLKQYPGKLEGGFYVNELSFKVGIGVAKSDASLGRAVAAAMRAMQRAGLETKFLKESGLPASVLVPATYVS